MEGPASYQCRVCLEHGASIPIFKTKGSAEDHDVYIQLCQCVGEKIEDLDGYPRHLCKLCHNTLVTATRFIEQYRKSAEILFQNINLVNLKDEIQDVHFDADDDYHAQNEDWDTLHKDDIDMKKEFIEKLVSNTPIKQKRDNDESGTKVKRICRSSRLMKTTDSSCSLIESDKSSASPKNSLEKADHKVKHKAKSNAANVIGKRKRKTKTKDSQIVPEKKTETKDSQTVPEIKGKSSEVSPLDPNCLCEQCGQVFPDKTKLNKHRNVAHDEHKCPHCPENDEVKYSKQNLQIHINKAHPPARPFVCPICGMAFKLKTTLTGHHAVVHEGKKRKREQRTKCGICKRDFASKISLLIHMRGIHTGERPEVCTVCGKSFAHHQYLTQHMRLHTGEKPFKCPVCNQGFAQVCNMKSHIKRIHRVSDLDEATKETLSKSRTNYLRLMRP